MKKLSKIMLMEAKTPVIDKGEVQGWQSLILFDGVLDGEKILASREIQKLLIYFYGQPRLSMAKTNYPEDLQAWLREEMYKADINGRAMIVPLKMKFEDMVVNGCGKEYTRPLVGQVFKANAALEYELLVLTCHWTSSPSDGCPGVENPAHIIGVIGDTDDLITIVDENLKRD